MTDTPEIFAVIWNDFIPLSLPCQNATEALAKAEDMRMRASASGFDVDKMDIRAVRVPAGEDILIILHA